MRKALSREVPTSIEMMVMSYTQVSDDLLGLQHQAPIHKLEHRLRQCTSKTRIKRLLPLPRVDLAKRISEQL